MPSENITLMPNGRIYWISNMFGSGCLHTRAQTISYFRLCIIYTFTFFVAIQGTEFYLFCKTNCEFRYINILFISNILRCECNIINIIFMSGSIEKKIAKKNQVINLSKTCVLVCTHPMFVRILMLVKSGK